MITTDQKVGSSNLFERTEQHFSGYGNEYGGLKGPIRLTEGEAEPDPQCQECGRAQQDVCDGKNLAPCYGLLWFGGLAATACFGDHGSRGAPRLGKCRRLVQNGFGSQCSRQASGQRCHVPSRRCNAFPADRSLHPRLRGFRWHKHPERQHWRLQRPRRARLDIKRRPLGPSPQAGGRAYSSVGCMHEPSPRRCL